VFSTFGQKLVSEDRYRTIKVVMNEEHITTLLTLKGYCSSISFVPDLLQRM
jgi:hypothetical protein